MTIHVSGVSLAGGLAGSAPLDNLDAELFALIALGRRCLTFEVLGGKRVGYGTRFLAQLGKQSEREFGRGIASNNGADWRNSRRLFHKGEIVSTLLTQLTWSRLVFRPSHMPARKQPMLPCL